MTRESNRSEVSLLSKLAYGMGDVGCNFSWMFVGNFLMIFYTDVFGIGMSAVATLMLVSRFWDAVNDPIIGALSDKTRTRWGRYRPWLLFSAPLTALVLALTFWAHPAWSQSAKIVYMAVTYSILVLGYTCVNIPYGTLCGAMTQNIDERAQLNTSRSVSAMIAIGVINIVTIPLIGFFGGGSAQHGYLLTAVLYGAILAACHIFCFAKTKEVVEIPPQRKLPLRVQLRAVAKNRPYLLALLGQVLFGFILYGRNADMLYYFTYVEGSATLFSLYSLAIIGPSILGAACFPPVFRRTSNKGWAASVFALGTGATMIALYFFSPNTSPILFYLFARCRSSSSRDSTRPSTPSSPTAWNTANGPRGCATTDSNTPSSRWATRSAWRWAPRCWRWRWARPATSPTPRRTPPSSRSCGTPSAPSRACSGS